MKKFVLPAVASVMAATNVFAADLPRKALAPIAPVALPSFTWTGFYLGVNAGAGWSDDSARSRAGTDEDTNIDLKTANLDHIKYKSNGFVGGGQVGYNYQFAPGNGFVVGVEADIDYVDLKKKRQWQITNVSTFSDSSLTEKASVTTHAGLDYLGTARGRLGYAFDRVLVYGTGGLAYGQVNYHNKFAVDYSLSIQNTTPTAGRDLYEISKSSTQTGYAFGGGIEYALPADSFLNILRSNAVTVKAEYLHYDLGTQKVSQLSSNGKTVIYTTKVKSEGDLVRAGLNFKFGI